MAFSTPPPIKSTNVNMVTDEKFVQIYPSDGKAVQLLNNERTVININYGLHACALGIHSYSSGIHRIQIRIDKGTANLGIRSRNIPPTPDEVRWGHYGFSPSTYGWGRNCTRIINGRCSYSEETNVIKDPGVLYTITLNCDEHRLSIINEHTKQQDEIEVDVSCAPFPWCLFIALSRMTSQVSLI